MADFKNNPDKPYEVKCPNRIRKKIRMAEKSVPDLDRRVANLSFLAKAFTRKFWMAKA